jgi:hypothetical protein
LDAAYSFLRLSLFTSSVQIVYAGLTGGALVSFHDTKHPSHRICCVGQELLRAARKAETAIQNAPASGAGDWKPIPQWRGSAILLFTCRKRRTWSTRSYRGAFRRGEQFHVEFQFVYLSQSKFQSIPLCSVDVPDPSVQTCSLFYEEGVYETQTDFAGDIIGRGGDPTDFAVMQHSASSTRYRLV